MLAVIPEQLKHERIAILGYHVPPGIPRITWKNLLKMRRDRWRIWHARRNVDMLAGLILRHLLRFRLKLLFTSAAQRRHTGITRFYYKRMDAVIATTAKAASFLECPATVVRHGVDTLRFQPAGEPGRYALGAFGRIRPNKGSEDFVDALLAVLPARPEWSVVFVGEAESAEYERRLQGKLEAAGLAGRVQFTGFVSHDELPQCYRSLRVVVCPSREEGFGLPCLEAMASGCPVVATRAGAWPEIVQEDVTGKLVDAGDVAGMTAALLAITEDPDRAVRMGRQARDFVEREFAIANEASGIQQVYDALLGPAR